MSFIRAKFYDEKLARIVPVSFRINNRHLEVFYQDREVAVRWPLSRVRILHGPADAKPLRLVCGSDTEAYLEPEMSVNISWLAGQCPNFYRKPRGPIGFGKIIGIIAVLAIFYAVASGAGEKALLHAIQFANSFSQVAQEKPKPVEISTRVRNLSDRSLCLGLASENPEYVAEANTRKLNKTSCENIVNSNAKPSGTATWQKQLQGKYLAKMSKLDLCRVATIKEAGSYTWDKKRNVDSYIQEAVRRDYSPDYCDRAINGQKKPQSKKTDTPDSRHYLANSSNRLLCRMATKEVSGKREWDDLPTVADYIGELKERGVTTLQCSAIMRSTTNLDKRVRSQIPTGRKGNAAPKNRNTTRKTISDAEFFGSQPTDRLCRMATKDRGRKLLWDSTPSTIGYIKEAQKRGYTLKHCADALFFVPKQPDAIQSPIIKVSAAVLFLSDRMFCKGFQHRNPEYVQDAIRRRLNTSKCEKILRKGGLPLNSIYKEDPYPEAFFKKKSLAQLCQVAVKQNNDHYVWNRTPQTIGYLREVLFRGTTIDQCSDILRSTTNLDKRVRSQAPTGWEGNSALKTTSDAKFYASQPEKQLCRMATKDAGKGHRVWDRSRSAKGYVKEAIRRGYTRVQCAQLLQQTETSKPTPPAHLTQNRARALCWAAFGHRLRDEWPQKWYVGLSSYAYKAQQQGLTPEQCGSVLRVWERAKYTNYNNFSDKKLCTFATTQVRGTLQWERRAKYFRYLVRAKHRQLKIEKCRTLLSQS